MREVERSGASVEEALEAALTELGASEQEAEVEIVQEPKSGFLGLGASEAVVLRHGLVGLGSFDETGEFRNVKIAGEPK